MLQAEENLETAEGIDELNILDQLNKLNLDDEEEESRDNNGKGVGLAEATRGILNPSNPIFDPNRKSSKVILN